MGSFRRYYLSDSSSTSLSLRSRLFYGFRVVKSQTNYLGSLSTSEAAHLRIGCRGAWWGLTIHSACARHSLTWRRFAEARVDSSRQWLCGVNRREGESEGQAGPSEPHDQSRLYWPLSLSLSPSILQKQHTAHSLMALAEPLPMLFEHISKICGPSSRVEAWDFRGWVNWMLFIVSCILHRCWKNNGTPNRENFLFNGSSCCIITDWIDRCSLSSTNKILSILQWIDCFVSALHMAHLCCLKWRCNNFLWIYQIECCITNLRSRIEFIYLFIIIIIIRIRMRQTQANK